MGLSRRNRVDGTKKTRSRKVKVSDRYYVNTFAGVRVNTEIVEIECAEKGIYLGKLLEKESVDKLREAGVPYERNEDPEKCISVVYDFQIIKKIISRGPESNKKKRRYVRKKIDN